MIWLLLGFALFGVLVLGMLGLVSSKVHKPMNKSYFDRKWQEILTMVKTQEGLALAVISADKLVDEALKRRGYRGKTMGERLVSAQHRLSDNDAIWSAHKLRNKLVHENDHPTLKPNETKRALSNFKQALRDMEAM